MLNKSTVFELSRQGYQLLNGSKGHTSRALRRFLTLVTDGHGDRIIQSFAYDEGYSKEQLDALVVYAARVVDYQQEYLPQGSVQCNGQMRDDCFGIVGNVYTLAHPLVGASVAQLRAMVTAAVVLADCMHEFAANPQACISSTSAYTYRGLPCSIAEGDKLWYVAGQDLLNGGGGVLEWCFDEADANRVLQNMQRFPDRFAHLVAQSWADEMARAEQAQQVQCA